MILQTDLFIHINQEIQENPINNGGLTTMSKLWEKFKPCLHQGFDKNK